ncbi:hypothetical protein SAMN05660649_03836 [Desulfotomaculum arcticum]|uniref:Uncharacterized protein n=1 Tax=Desulfotruncus arcticus DSM 17038 TaxID=1121424 RepID=A0A1I2XC68_9FIRM|nr:hypothetical protein [Desulfotruncus arcticus]SFH09611.1 hypothetical protein SAMN05660649_03836 [Desulfotomaculum arcticum] [Desulfotruncus arcticus DSM 17038]
MAEIKKKVLSVTLGLVFTWLVVSIYFYSQHLIVIKEYPLYTRAETEDALIILKNVVAYNYKTNYSFINHESPWYWKVAMKINNPRIQRIFISTCFFYSRPYIFDPEKRTVKLQGLIAFKNVDQNNSDSLFEDNPFKVNLYGDFDASLTDGSGASSSGNSNIMYFEVHGDEVLLNNNHVFKAVIKDSQTGQVIKELPFKPDWRYSIYNFWQSKPEKYGFKPGLAVDRFINLVERENYAAAANCLHYKRKDVFPWTNLDSELLASPHTLSKYYVGDYLDYKNVFAADILFFKPGRQALSQGDEFARQTIFLIDNYGQWKIIDAAPCVKTAKEQA